MALCYSSPNKLIRYSKSNKWPEKKDFNSEPITSCLLMFATNQFKTRFCSVCFWPLSKRDGQSPIPLDDRTGQRKGLEHPGYIVGDSTTRPWSHWGAITSPGRDLVNPFIQILSEELWTRAVVHKLGCICRSPWGALRKFRPSLSPTPDQLDQNLWGWGLGMSIF